ncbi:hypothetical protein EJO69_06780 [Flaviflexus salsibiostraticola]|uniref:RAMA domain-containing protein n=1 Tax=Flaviflexus salsibiostraticola TaxID=1282737 RepID=A0A3S8Z9J8_9ACTO|nr:DUF4357 domain-containing protein [Flaviflexus salsibiostraticola]AZN30045.1 hypothetical protein EJO69_06780 [Flaviflexus salsibiostraticola]
MRDQVVELIYRPVFPVAWLTETSRGPGRHTSLVALDPSSKTVTIDVVEDLDASILMASLARASRHEEIPSGALSGLYPRGVAAFRKDWQEFQDSCPTGMEDHPRLIILAVNVADEVRAALDTLVGASIEVHRIDLHESRSGILVSLEQVRPHEASFLAIGQAVRRGELTAPTSETGDAPTADSGEMPSLSSSESPDTAADVETDSEPDGVVFVSRGDVAIPARQPFTATDDEAPESASSSDDDVVSPGDDSSDAETETPLDDSQPEYSEPDSAEPDDSAVAEDSSTDDAVADGPALSESDDDGDSVRARAVLSEEAIFADSLGRPASRRRDARAVREEFTFHSVGFSGDGRTLEGADERGSVAWPVRETELQKIVARHGEQSLTFKSLRRRINAAAVLDASGEIVLENGERFTDPDAAASAVAGREMDGWKNWRTREGRRLGELRF